jgi:hypothetical protein
MNGSPGHLIPKKRKSCNEKNNKYNNSLEQTRNNIHRKHKNTAEKKKRKERKPNEIK